MANSVVHFEIFASNVERARRFYEQAFGWRFESGGPPDFYHVYTGPDGDPGLTLGLMAKRRAEASQGAINAYRCTISVKSIDDSCKAITAAGGKLRSGVADIPGVGKVVEFADSEDNIVCVMEYEPHMPFAAK